MKGFLGWKVLVQFFRCLCGNLVAGSELQDEGWVLGGALCALPLGFLQPLCLRASLGQLEILK